MLSLSLAFVPRHIAARSVANAGPAAATRTTLHKLLLAFLGPVALAGVLVVGFGHVLGHAVALALIADLLDLACLGSRTLLAGCPHLAVFG